MSNFQEKVPLNTNAAIAPVNIKKFVISDREGNAVDLTGSLTQFYFYESVLSNYVSATVEIVDSGYVLSADGKLNAKPGGIMGNSQGNIYPVIGGGNRVDFDIEDNNYNNRVDIDGRGKSLNNLKMPDGMYVSRIRDVSTSSLKNYYAIDLVSKEAFTNELVRVSKRYDGKISDSVKKIVKDVLRVEESLIEVEETALTHNFIGNDSKPFGVCTKLASKGVPLPVSNIPTINRRAGFVFFQTRLGMHFVSLANRFFGEEDKKNRDGRKVNVVNTSEGRKYTFRVKNFVSTSAKSIDLDQGDNLILTYTVDTSLDTQKDLALGSYNNRTIFFDFYSMDYKVRDFDIIADILDRNEVYKETFTAAVLEGKTIPQLRALPDRALTYSPSRLMSHVLDIGTLPSGVTSEAELESWRNDPLNPTNDAPKNMVQSIMQYNNLFREKLNIVVAGDFSMVAGNIVYCVFEAVGGGGSSVGNEPEEDKNLTGNYMIANVCHRVTPTETYTSMDLVPVARLV